MTTLVVSDTTATNRAVELLRRGETVALPTETVYGLAADALDPIAVAKIFEAKSRPDFDPLIVHLPDKNWLEKIVDIPAEDRSSVIEVAERFWPGPLTMVLPRREIVPSIVTAGLDTVAVRISAHPVFAEVVRELGKPLAAPSANRFGRISPTTAQHVFDELNGRIPLIVDSGPTTHGIESTIITIRSGKFEILRRGPIISEQLAPFATKVDFLTDKKSISAPGQLPSHYAPKTLLQLIDDPKEFAPAEGHQVGLLAWNLSNSEKRFAAVRHLSESHDLREAAANLFRYLRELDALDLDLIVAERVPAQGLGAAIMDRLTKAARGSIDT